MNSESRGRQARVSAIVVTWNSGKDIVSCIESLVTQSYPLLEIIVIDNSSKDNSVTLVKKGFPHVRLLRMERNLGFAGANNVGISNSEGEYVLTVNPDVVLKADYVEKLVGTLDRLNRNVGSATGKLLRDDGVTLDSTGIKAAVAVRFFDRGAGEPDRGQYDTEENILGPCAAAALYKRKMLQEIMLRDGYFDSSFFAFFEDVDLAYRARIAGWDSIYVPEATAVHKRGGSGTRRSLVQFYALRNRLKILVRDIPVSTLLRQAGFLAVYEVLRFFWVSLSNPLALSSYYQVLQQMSALLKDRRRILKA